MRLFLILSCSLLLLLSCKHKCPEGFECIDDVCICPEGRFEGFGMCRELAANEYYGTFDCLIQDTIFITFLEKKEASVNIKLDYNDELAFSGLRLIEFPTYDSLYSGSNDFTGLIGQTTINGECCHYARIFGRLTSDKFSGKMEWRRGDNEPIETCPLELRR